MKQSFVFICLSFCCGLVRAQQPASAAPYYTSPDFFPIAVWAQPPYDLQKYKNMGVNVYMGMDWSMDAGWLSDLHQHPVYIFPSADDTFAQSHRSDTLIYGWLLTDEPDNAQWNAKTNSYDSCINPNVTNHQCDSLRLADPVHPIYFGLDQGVSNTGWVGRGPCTNWLASYPVYDNGYLKGPDFSGYDIYPVNNTDATTSGKLWYVAKGIDSLLLWTSKTASPRVPSKPIWIDIETTRISSSSAAGPTPAQTKSEVWMAIIHGAKGIDYFPDSWIPSFTADALLNDAAMVKTLTSVDSMIRALAPVLNSSNTGYATNTNANTPGVSSSNGAVPVNFMTKTYNGANYIFAVAMRPGAATATFTVTSGNTVTVLGENRTLPVSGGKFSDSFAADYQVHLYKITSTTGIGEEAGIGNSINVYPNPFSEAFTVEVLSSALSPFDFRLYDLAGKLIREQTNLAVQSFSVPRNGLPAGMYFYELRNKSGVSACGKVALAE